MMTSDRLAGGLLAIVRRMANDQAPPPAGWTPQEWAYVLGIASAQIMLLHDLFATSTQPDRPGEDQ